MVTIDEVKNRSNLDVFWALPYGLEGRLESPKNTIAAKGHSY
jgi:hypothetical protein